MILLLLRHAAHEEAGRVLSGRTDAAPLTEAGHAALRSLETRLRPHVTYCSPRRRTRETAAIFGFEPVVEPALDEIDFGSWTGRPFAALETDPAWQSWNTQRATARPPGGEAMHEAQSRVLRWVETLPARHPDATVLAISHADVIKAAICAHLGLTLDAHWRFDIAPASLSALELWPGGGRVRFINDNAAEA
jgi:probable phosphoglycerate mutase